MSPESRSCTGDSGLFSGQSRVPRPEKGKERGEDSPAAKEMSDQKKPVDKKHEALQALKFTLFSISAGIIQIGTYTLFFEAFHWAPWLAYLVSLVLSVLWNFTFNRKYTFRSDADLKKSMLLVGLFYLIFTPLSTWWTAVLTGANPFTGAEASSDPLVNNYIVEIGTMLVNFVTEFLYQKFVVYRGTIDSNQKEKKRT